jgi:hypothetical protein
MTDASLSETAVLINDAIAKYELPKAIELISKSSDVTGVDLGIVISNLDRTNLYLEQDYVLSVPEQLEKCNIQKSKLTEILMLLLEKKVKLGGLLFNIKDVSIAKLLIEHGANVNEVLHGNKPIHCTNSYEMIKLFIEHGADVNDVNRWGEKLIDSTTSLNMIKLLVENDAEVNGCFVKNIADFIKYIYEHGQYVDYGSSAVNADLGGFMSTKNTSGFVRQHFEICKFLLNNGANPDITINDMKLIEYLHTNTNGLYRDFDFRSLVKELLDIIFNKYPDIGNFYGSRKLCKKVGDAYVDIYYGDYLKKIYKISATVEESVAPVVHSGGGKVEEPAAPIVHSGGGKA